MVSESAEPETLSQLVLVYLGEQCAVIIDAAPGLRAREPIIHPTRVAVRRLRSTIRTYAPLFDSVRSAALEAELVWWAGLLGVVRDMEVQGRRIDGLLAELAPELVVGPIQRQVQEAVQSGAQQGWSDIHANLDSDRYAALVADLEAWRSAPPYTERAAVPAAKVKKYVRAANAKLDKRLQRAVVAAAAGDPEADELFHSARKAGKRARYAVELALPLWGDKAEQIIAERKDLQDVLGEHQDSIVSAQFLREQGIRSGNRSGHNGFTYGLLYAQQLARAASVSERLKPFGVLR